MCIEGVCVLVMRAARERWSSAGSNQHASLCRLHLLPWDTSESIIRVRTGGMPKLLPAECQRVHVVGRGDNSTADSSHQQPPEEPLPSHCPVDVGGLYGDLLVSISVNFFQPPPDDAQERSVPSGPGPQTLPRSGTTRATADDQAATDIAAVRAQAGDVPPL